MKNQSVRLIKSLVQTCRAQVLIKIKIQPQQLLHLSCKVFRLMSESINHLEAALTFLETKPYALQHKDVPHIMFEK